MYETYCKLRDAKGLTDYKVAQDLGFSRSTLTQWKSGKFMPKADKLQKIADYFGVSVEYLMTGEVKEGYYINEETARVAQEIFENKDLRILFDSARGNKPENLMLAAEMLRKLKETNPDG